MKLALFTSKLIIITIVLQQSTLKVIVFRLHVLHPVHPRIQMLSTLPGDTCQVLLHQRRGTRGLQTDVQGWIPLGSLEESLREKKLILVHCSTPAVSSDLISSSSPVNKTQWSYDAVDIFDNF